MNEPLASVIVSSYNHEKYIKEALESILFQQVNFEYKVYLADDCSTDNTREILKEYIEKYPQVFIPLYPEINLGLVKNMKNAFDKSKSKYILMLEGDDFWTHKYKMQKQIDFLENNNLCPMVANRIWVKDEINNKNYPNFAHIDSEIIKTSESIFYLTTPSLIAHNYIGNYSAMAFRREAINNLNDSVFEEKLWDWLFSMFMSLQGPVAFINEPMSVYRLVRSGQWNSKTNLIKLKEVLELIPVYDKLLNYVFHKEFKALNFSILLNYVKLRFSDILKKDKE